MVKSLQNYHFAWLDVHPQRSVEWLRERLKDGFDIHHIDGNHKNNDPANLILIESHDHFMLHSGVRLTLRKLNVSGPRKETLERGCAALKLRAKGKTWREVGAALGCTGTGAMSAARVYRKHK